MLKKIKLLTCFALVATVARAGIGIPAQNLNANSIGFEYSGTMRGQYITDFDVASHEYIHSLYLHYAPVPYILLSGGFGVDRFTVDEHAGRQFEGDYGFAPLFGVSLFAPVISDLLRLNGGFTMMYLNSKDTPGYAYRGPIFNPYLGVIFSMSSMVDWGLGAKGHIISGSMGNTKDDSFTSFSNRNKVRGYLNFTLHSPGEGAYLNMEGDFSPAVSRNLENGPVEASLSASVGVILRAPRSEKESDFEEEYFPAYKEMKEKQKRMEAGN